jgi:hypothetical protein
VAATSLLALIDDIASRPARRRGSVTYNVG